MKHRISAAIGTVVLMAAAYLGARYWQQDGPAFRHLSATSACDLRVAPCLVETGVGLVSLGIVPRDIPLMQPLRLAVDTGDLVVERVSVEMRGLNMDMGLNRTQLGEMGPGQWRGETILPVCSQRRMEWQAVVRLYGASPLELSFLFYTERPLSPPG